MMSPKMSNNYNAGTGASSLKKLSLILLSGLALASCASTESGKIIEDDLEIYDPYEGYNRFMFNFNQHFDDVVVNPVVKGYRFVTPRIARKGVRNFLRNIKSPVILANQLLQGDLQGAKNCALRAVINTTVGIGGIVDLAGYNGIEYEGEDFGQTLAVWGVDHGPYMVVPFLGPSSLRDYSGYFVDAMADPVRWHTFNVGEDELYYTKLTAEYVDLRESLYDTLKDIRENSLDPYAATRSIYFQSRAALVKDQGLNEGYAAPAIPDYAEED